MDIDEIQRYVSLGRNKAVCVDLKVINHNPVMVRSVTIYKDNIVWIRIRSYGYDEGGQNFKKQYDTLTNLVIELEEYLDTPIAEWHNSTKSGYYPGNPLQDDSKQTLADTIRRIPEGYINSKESL